MATLLLIVLTAGLASQWLAWQLKLPAIVILIAAGLLLGPVSGVIPPSHSPRELSGLIGLGVAIILFEGGMYLKLRELRETWGGVGVLVLLGPPLAWSMGAWAAHYVAGLSWPVAIVLGAILVVTGPTVILPLLRQARLNRRTAALLKWEAIANDPMGVLLAVMSFQYFTGPSTQLSASLQNLGIALAAGAVIGGAGGWLTGWLFRRGAVPVHLKAPILMVLVLAVYWLTNLVRNEAGLLAVTLMGMVIGNLQLVERQALQTFQENLAAVLLSVLFIVIPAQLDWQHLALIDWRALLFVLVLMFLVRPITIAIVTLLAPVSYEDKRLLAWIAPRGIVAAATAGLFGPALVEAGHADADKLLPLMFLIIFATVLAHGLTIRPLALRLKLAVPEGNGLLIVGASDFTVALAQALQRLQIEVQIVDGSWSQLKAARMAGVPVHYAEVLSEEGEHGLDTRRLSHLLCATDNDFYNALVCKAQDDAFGHHRTFQTATHDASAAEFKRLSIDSRGYFAFARDASSTLLATRVAEGWAILNTRLTESHGWDAFKRRLDESDPDWLLLGGISPKGVFRLYSPEQRFRLEADWTAIYFAPPAGRALKIAKAVAEAAASAAVRAATEAGASAAPSYQGRSPGSAGETGEV